MSTAMQQVDWSDDCLVPKTRNPELMREIRRAGGVVTPATNRFLALPWLARNNMVFYNGLLLHFDRSMGERLWLAVSQDQSCRYCYASLRMAMRFSGIPEKRIQRLEQDVFTTDLGREDRAMVELAQAVSRANPPATAADADELLQAGYPLEKILEGTAFAALTVSGNRLSTLIAAPVDFLEKAPDSWLGRAVRPLVAWRIRRAYRPGAPTTLAGDEEDGPYSYLVRALRGLPLSRTYRGYLRGAWASAALSPVTRGLVFAVVARGLGSRRAEAEALRLLDAEGFPEASAGEVLAHLRSPALDPLDLDIVRFARETIRVQPARIQKRAAELRSRMPLESFLDVIGSAALANGVARAEIVAELAS